MFSFADYRLSIRAPYSWWDVPSRYSPATIYSLKIPGAATLYRNVSVRNSFGLSYTVHCILTFDSMSLYIANIAKPETNVSVLCSSLFYHFVVGFDVQPAACCWQKTVLSFALIFSLCNNYFFILLEIIKITVIVFFYFSSEAHLEV